VEREQTTESGAPGRPAAAWAPGLDRQELAAVFAGGFIGALARAALVQGLGSRPGSWPWATFGANIAGALLLGYFITRLQERLPPSLYRRSFLGSGICGALTTFSTMMVELLRMLDEAHWALAVSYGAASVLCGLGAVFLSTKMVRRARLAR
jgi:CrcB protein